ncbi:DUF2780 domain-containing protein [Paraglaciecola sp. L3A3]|uniref:DUF2780 domain-containing protein n=1 Tax=Paraglaciecola sp. L3A3 TaxID=2686358 RepID=UPI00131BE6B4|nr:DUF2780 domain-containing protein [Paraglaciecola sp. L3A3]
MKTTQVLLLLSALSFSQVSLANDFLNSAKSLLGSSSTEDVTSSLNISDMVGSVSESLGITESQATGSLGSIFEYAKNNITKEQVASMGEYLPGLDSLLSAAPEVSTGSEEKKSGLGGLLSKASEYSDSLSAVAGLQKQFESLGLDADMITKVIQSAYSYLNTDQGQQVKALLEKGLSSLKL